MTDTIALDMALTMASAGYRIAPVTIRRDENGRKRPNYHRMSWDEVATDDQDVIQEWASRFGPDLGFVVAMVAADGTQLVGVDLDLKLDKFGAVDVDAVSWWAERGLPISAVCVDTPSGGQHQYWRMPEGLALPNSTGAIAPGVDVRGVGGHFYAPGTRVIGDDTPYRMTDHLLAPQELPILPAEIVKLIPEPRKRPRSREGGSSSRDIRDDEWVVKQCRDQLERVRNHPAEVGTGFRGVLMGAAMVLGRATAGGICSREHAEKRLTEATEACWGVVDAEDREWVVTGLDDGEADPWTIVPATPKADEHVPDAAADPDTYQRLLDAEVRKERLRQEAREILANERTPRPSIRDRLIDVRDLAAVEPPTMMMDRLIPDRAVGVLAGKFGTYKSFVAVSWACHLALGRPWLGRDEFSVRQPVNVLYVAAEGASGVAQRVQAWEREHTEIGTGALTVYPLPVHLNSRLAVAELNEVVGELDVRLLIVDTYRRSAPGVEDNSTKENGLIFEAVAGIRDQHDLTALFLDHTGHRGDRVRGASSKLDDADFGLTITLEGDSRDPDQQRTLEVVKLKDGATEGRWPLRIVPVDLDGTASGYIEIGLVSDEEPLFGDLGERWFNLAPEHVPDEIAELKGKGHRVARDIFRLLFYVGEVNGLSKAEINQALSERAEPFDASTFYAALRLLASKNITVAGTTSSKIALSPRFSGQ